MDSISYIPAELRDKDLFKLTSNLIDYTYELCNISDEDQETLISPLIVDLVKNYKDTEAVNAYYNLFINPIIGTKKAIDSIFSIIGDSGKVLEWFNASIWQYHYIIQYEDFSDSIDIERIIKLCREFENERSKLVAIRSSICGTPFRYDYSKWDISFYDNMEGTIVNGVYICFGKNNKYYKYVPELNIRQIYTNDYSQTIPLLYTNQIYDNFWYDYNQHDFINQYIDYNYAYSSIFGISPSIIYSDSEGNTSGDPLSSGEYRIFDTSNIDITIDRIPYYFTPNIRYSSYSAKPEFHYIKFKDNLEYIEDRYSYNYINQTEEYYSVSDDGIYIENIYSRTGTTLEVGVNPIGFINKIILDSIPKSILTNIRNKYNYINSDIDSFNLSINISDSTNNVLYNSNLNSIDSKIYQTIKYDNQE